MNFPINSSSSASDIEQIQRALVNSGFDVSIDGVFGPKTIAAVKAFQAANVDQDGRPLNVDGIVGPVTFASLTGSAAPPENTPSTPSPSPPHSFVRCLSRRMASNGSSRPRCWRRAIGQVLRPGPSVRWRRANESPRRSQHTAARTPHWNRLDRRHR